ncbi:hypothetical protein [Mycoplasmopsis pulmonis]|uniref:hypothetical protein n=1 Tax=Mycoplasmopsis pulmonis TaxID=2107 RepID=UPI002ACDC177|nr:hypothetical protein [Mycoplasmopsis pulmonis]MDZ7293712.1 hypothetical protein [Mycoplasmopsis pulmonis]
MANLKKMIITNGNILNSVSAFSPANNSIAAMSKYEKFELKQDFEFKEKYSIDDKNFFSIEDSSLMDEERDYVNSFLNSFDLPKLSNSSRSEINQEINNTYKNIKNGSISISEIKKQIEQNNPDFFNSIKPYIDNIDNIDKAYDFNINQANIDNYLNDLTLDQAQDIDEDLKALLKDVPDKKVSNLNNLHELYSNKQASILSPEKDLIGERWDHGYSPIYVTIVNDDEYDIELINLKAEFNKIKDDFEKTLKKANNMLYHLENYLKGLKAFNVLSATLTAASWALFSWYAAQSLWTFGTAIPFAVAVGVQSSIMTYFTSESFNTQYEVEKQIKEIKNELNSYQINKLKEDFKKGFRNWYKNLMELKEDIFFSPSAELKNFNLFTSRSKIRNEIFNELPKELSKELANKISRKTFKNHFLSNVLKKFSTNLTSKRAILIGTAWASPIGNIINLLDSVVGAANLLWDLGYMIVLK